MTKRNTAKVGTGYALAQLLRAESNPAGAAKEHQWRDVVAGMLNRTLRIGSRTPTKFPAWVSLEVVHGGFATGTPSAGGPLAPHELEKLAQLPDGDSSPRQRLNAHYLTPRGFEELAGMLESGNFRADTPEESALLIAVWLSRRGENQRAATLLRTIAPFFDTLRFYPAPSTTPVHEGPEVFAQSVGTAMESLKRVRRHIRIERMDEAIRIWTPLYDRSIALFLELIEGEFPHFATGKNGRYERESDGHPKVLGGVPSKAISVHWAARAKALLEDYESAGAQHTLCGKPADPKGSFAQLRRCMGKRAAGHPLSPGEQEQLRRILASYITKHGAPGSQRLRATREAQANNIALPRHRQVARLLRERLSSLNPNEGAADLDALLQPLSAREAASIGAAPGHPIAKSLVRKIERCTSAPLEELVARGILRSSAATAAILPQLTAHVQAKRIEDPALRRLYLTSYRAFRRRRSLLLLNLAQQVQFEELPWVQCMEDSLSTGAQAREDSRATLERLVRISLENFPFTIAPNELVRELQVLSNAAGLELPLVKEIAADIFMGSFSMRHLQAAQAASKLLQGTLYESYYGICYEATPSLSTVAFAELCRTRARQTKGWSVAGNGAVIEQAQILTTHNLAVLCSALREPLTNLPGLAKESFRWICRRQSKVPRTRWAQLKMLKNTAYAWRHILFFLSLADPGETERFLAWATTELHRFPEAFANRFAPVLDGLALVHAGGCFDENGAHPSGARRFVGWTRGNHWLMPELPAG